MKRCGLSLVILQLMIGLYGLKAEESEDFCFKKLQFISIFNLGEHTIFQDQNKHFWKLNESDIMGPVDTSVTMMEKTVRIDDRMTKFLSDKFDLSSIVFGFTVSIDDDDESQCNSTTDPQEKQECIEVTLDPNIYFTCFFGFDTSISSWDAQKLDVFIYNYSALNEFGSKSLKSRVWDYCRNESFGKIADLTGVDIQDIKLMGGLQYFEEDSEHNYTRLRRQILITPVINESFVKLYAFYDEYDDNNNQSVLKKDQTYMNTFQYDSMFYAFRYNKHFGVLGCPFNCNIRTKLSMFNIVKDEGNETTIEDLIRCPVTKPWNPNEFCHQKGFISVFSLGKDTIFQNEGKIWRYISTGAHSRGNPDLIANIESIRFDTDLLAFLDYYFDTSRPVYGFTFKHEDQDMCDSLDDDSWEVLRCQEHFLDFPQLPYYRSCIYGISLIPGQQNELKSINNTFAFKYTPSGLSEFSNKIVEKETLDFCKKVPSSLGTSFQMKAILGETFINPDANTDIYALFKNLNSGAIHSYKTSVRQSTTLKNELDWVSLNSEELNGTVVNSINYISFEREIVGMTSQNLSDIYLLSEVCARVDFRTGKLQPLSESFNSVYNCPFNQTYSEPTLEEESLCTDFSGVFSLFQIGEVVYYQKGKRFFRAFLEKDRRKFIFDKYFTDLMNDNFDTNYRVLGYSYRINYNEYRVFIMGSTKYDTKSLGPKIFRAYTVGISPLSPLEVLNDVSALYYSDVNIGLKDVALNYSRFDAMVYLDPDNTFVVREYPKRDELLSWILVVILNGTQLYYTNNKKGFEFPFRNKFIEEFLTYKKYLDDIPFTQIFGLFQYDKAIYASGWSRNQTKDQMPRIFKIYDYRSKIERIYFLAIDELTSEPFDSFFNCKDTEKQSDSTSDTNDALYLFIVLILLLLLTGGVVGLIAWDNKKSNTKSSQNSNSIKSLKVSNDSIKSEKSQSNVSKSSESTEQKKSETKPVPNDKQIAPISKTGTEPSNDAKSGHSSIIQIRSDIGD